MDFGGTYNFQGDEILSATLDIAGIFDPFGIADGLNAALQLNNGDPEGFKKIKERTSNGQPIFRKGNKYFSPDRDQHSGGTWKRADSPKALESKATRDGTYDENLQRIGD